MKYVYFCSYAYIEMGKESDVQRFGACELKFDHKSVSLAEINLALAEKDQGEMRTPITFIFLRAEQD